MNLIRVEDFTSLINTDTAHDRQECAYDWSVGLKRACKYIF